MYLIILGITLMDGRPDFVKPERKSEMSKIESTLIDFVYNMDKYSVEVMKYDVTYYGQ